MSDPQEYATMPALSPDEWYAEHRQPEIAFKAEPPGEGVASIEKSGSVVKLTNERGQQVWIGNDDSKKALAAIALRSFGTKDGRPFISHELLDRLAQGPATPDDLAVLRSLLPPREFEAYT